MMLEAANSRSNSHRARIAVCDDTPAALYATARILRAAGYEVIEACTGAAGLSAAQHADLLVLDINLPDMDGFEVCRTLRARTETAHLPVLHLSATFVNSGDVVNGFEAGADSYLKRPVEPSVLVATVRTLLFARQAEATRRSIDAKCRTMFQLAPIAIAILNEQDVYESANPAYCALTGFSAAELVGRPHGQFLTPESCVVMENAPTLSGTDTPTIRRLQFRRKDGTIVDLDCNVAEKDESGIRIVIATDVTEQLRAQRARQLWESRLQESEERLQIALTAAQAGMYDWAIETGHDTWSAGHYSLLGLEPFSVPARHGLWRQHVHPEDMEPVQARLRRALDFGERFSAEYRLLSADGVERWVKDQGMLIERPDKPRRMVGTIVDITALKRAEHALRIEKERLSSVLNGITDEVWFADREGRLTPANPAALRHSCGQAPSCGSAGLTSGAANQAAVRCPVLEAPTRRALAGESVDEERTEQESPGEEWRFRQIKAAPVRDAHGEIIGAVSLVRDVTESKRIERAFRATFENAAIGIAHVAIDGRLLKVNDQYCEIVGYRREELLGQTFDQLTHPDDVEANWARVRALIAGEIATYSMEKRYIRKDGSLVWANLTVSLVRDGAPPYFVSVVEDITPRKQVEEVLRQSEQVHRISYDLSPIGMAHMDLDMRFIKVNERFCQITGYTAEELLHMSTTDLTLPEDRTREADMLAAFLDGTIPAFVTEKRYARKDGKLCWVIVTARLVTDRMGRPLYSIGVVQEITARKEFEDALRQADRRKDVFIATLAHELRNPLAPIRTAAQILGSAQVTPPQLRWAQTVIQRQVRHMALLLDDLLDIARITQGKLELKTQAVRFTDILESALEVARPLMESKGHDFVMSLPPAELTLRADPLRLSQVLSNLLTNATKYTDPSGHIELRAEVADEQLHLSVTDDGIGISADSLEGIFEMFSQIDEGSTRSAGGLGIGLALVRGIVELHGGRIEARSEGPGRGATFTVRLPVIVGG